MANNIIRYRSKSAKQYMLCVDLKESLFFVNLLCNELYFKYRYMTVCNKLSSMLLFNNNSEITVDRLLFFEIFCKSVRLHKCSYENCCFTLWINFIKFVNFYKFNKIGFKLELNFIGLGFYIKKLTDNLYKFFLGYPNYIYIFITQYMKLQYIGSKRKLLLFGIDKNYINSIASVFLLLLNVSVYRLTGIVKLGRVVRLKVGKKR